MEPRERPEPEPGSERARLTPEDALRQLEARLERASEAAQRLLADATARAASARAAGGETEPRSPGDTPSAPEGPDAAATEPPPAGWQAPDTGPPSAGPDLELLLGIVHSVRDLIPPELQRRLAEALRELLLALRALIDWYLDRVERRPAEPTEVQDIPIQ
jgi:hypothetical protein